MILVIFFCFSIENIFGKKLLFDLDSLIIAFNYYLSVSNRYLNEDKENLAFKKK